MKNAQYVYFNDGEREDVFALVIAEKDDTKLDLIVFSHDGVSSTVRDIPRREPKDYGPEGGGDTWHNA